MAPCSVIRMSQPSLGWHKLRVRQRMRAAGSGVSPEDRYSKNTETGMTSMLAEAFSSACEPPIIGGRNRGKERASVSWSWELCCLEGRGRQDKPKALQPPSATRSL